MGEERKVYKVLVGKPEGKRPLGRPRRRWEDGIRMDLREIGLGGCGLDSTGSGQGPVAGCCECGDEPSGSCATELVSLMTSPSYLCVCLPSLHQLVNELVDFYEIWQAWDAIQEDLNAIIFNLIASTTLK
jgi:hypothetical protein